MPLRMSTLFLRTLRDDPAEAEVASHRLLVRAGYIRRAAPGIYSWLPLGLKVGRDGLRDYLLRVHGQGVAHVMFNLVDNGRPMDAVLREIGEQVLPHMLG